jgi:hypothetical protein
LFGDMIAEVDCENCDGEGGYWVTGTAGPGSRIETPPEFWQVCLSCNGNKTRTENAWQFVARVVCDPLPGVVPPGTVEDRYRDTVARLLDILEELGSEPDAGYRWEILKRLRPVLARAVKA